MLLSILLSNNTQEIGAKKRQYLIMDYKALMAAEKAKMLKESLMQVKTSSLTEEEESLVSCQNDGSSKASDESLSKVVTTQSTSVEIPLDLDVNLNEYRLTECPIEALYYVPDVLNSNTADVLLSHINNAGNDNNTELESMSLWKSLADSSNNSQKQWTKVRGRKLQQWGKMIKTSVVELNAAIDADTTEAQTEVHVETGLPPWLHTISTQLTKLTIPDNKSNIQQDSRTRTSPNDVPIPIPIFPLDRAPNHVLINEYRTQGGILHHTDGPYYYPMVAILSIGGPVLMTFKKRPVHGTDTTSTSADVDVLKEPKDKDEDKDEDEDEDDEYSVLLENNSLLVFCDSIYSDWLHGIDDGVYSDTITTTTNRSRSRSVSCSKREYKCVNTDKKYRQRHSHMHSEASTADEKEVTINSSSSSSSSSSINKSADLVTGQRFTRQKRTSLTFRTVVP